MKIPTFNNEYIAHLIDGYQQFAIDMSASKKINYSINSEGKVGAGQDYALGYELGKAEWFLTTSDTQREYENDTISYNLVKDKINKKYDGLILSFHERLAFGISPLRVFNIRENVMRDRAEAVIHFAKIAELKDSVNFDSIKLLTENNYVSFELSQAVAQLKLGQVGHFDKDYTSTAKWVNRKYPNLINEELPQNQLFGSLFNLDGLEEYLPDGLTAKTEYEFSSIPVPSPTPYFI